MKDNIFPVKVYCFIDVQGHHYGYEVAHSEEELADIIVSNEQDKLVTDFMDLPVFDTFGIFVNRVYDNTEEWGADAPNYKPWFFNCFQSVLLKAQYEYSKDYNYTDEDKLYDEMCSNCTNAKRCHEECTHCEEFLNRLEGGEE